MTDQQPYGPQQPYGQPPHPHSGQPDWQPQSGQSYSYSQPGYHGPQPGGTPPLDQPWYGIGFVAAVKRAFQKYARFDGRASRREYWWFVLALYATLIAFGLLFVLAAAVWSSASGNPDDPGPVAIAIGILLFLVLLGALVPSLSITVRRLHDVDLSGWFILLRFIPYIGDLVLLVFTVQQGKPSGARFDRPSTSQPLYG